MYEITALKKACGKFELLSKMLKVLKRENHRVLVFSQVSTSIVSKLNDSRFVDEKNVILLFRFGESTQICGARQRWSCVFSATTRRKVQLKSTVR